MKIIKRRNPIEIANVLQKIKKNIHAKPESIKIDPVDLNISANTSYPYTYPNGTYYVSTKDDYIADMDTTELAQYIHDIIIMMLINNTPDIYIKIDDNEYIIHR